mgnify:CR=1 FL=1
MANDSNKKYNGQERAWPSSAAAAALPRARRIEDEAVLGVGVADAPDNVEQRPRRVPRVHVDPPKGKHADSRLAHGLDLPRHDRRRWARPLRAQEERVVQEEAHEKACGKDNEEARLEPKRVRHGNGEFAHEAAEHDEHRHGEDAVVASDIHQLDGFHLFEYVDIKNRHRIREVIQRHKVNEIYHLAAILSANAEQQPTKAWNINMDVLLYILETGVEFDIQKIFFPSSIAVFGNHANLKKTGQFQVQHPTTLYGISKSAGENWCQYYGEKYNLEVRSLR